MILNAAVLSEIYVNLRAEFNQGLGLAASDWARVAMRSTSSTDKEKYPWLKNLPNMRQWIGDRQVTQLAAASYEITNLAYENTFEIDVNDIKDDKFGTFGVLARLMGESKAQFADEQVFTALKNGFSTLCHDGQYFFDTDHPLLDADGNATTGSNSGGGSGEPWFLLATRQAMKPIIWQVREENDFRQLTPAELIERNRKIEYGCDMRCATGYGFWQLAYGSKATLDSTNFATAYNAMLAFKGDYGRKLGIRPDLLVVGPANHTAARAIINSEYVTASVTNVWKGVVDLLVTPYV